MEVVSWIYSGGLQIKRDFWTRKYKIWGLSACRQQGKPWEWQNHHWRMYRLRVEKSPTFMVRWRKALRVKLQEATRKWVMRIKGEFQEEVNGQQWLMLSSQRIADQIWTSEQECRSRKRKQKSELVDKPTVVDDLDGCHYSKSGYQEKQKSKLSVWEGRIVASWVFFFFSFRVAKEKFLLFEERRGSEMFISKWAEIKGWKWGSSYENEGVGEDEAQSSGRTCSFGNMFKIMK